MTVCLCIASRDRPGPLVQTVGAAMGLAEMSETVTSTALDSDDSSCFVLPPAFSSKTSVADRETSLGAKYNRAAKDYDADVYVLGVDDAYPSNKGWDQKLSEAAARFTDGVGVVFFGEKRAHPYDLPDGIAVTRKWIEQVGFFCPPYFPFWWHDTWIDELAKLTGRYTWADVTWEKHGKSEVGGHKTTRMREVAWWAKFFDATRQMRVDKAIEMINGSDDPPWLKTQLKQGMQWKCDILWQRNGRVRGNGHQYERDYGATYEPDAGYDQIKTEAVAMMERLASR